MPDDVITINMTPTFRGLLVPLLAAYTNMERKLAAESCDGRANDWCTVHDQPYERAGEGCAYWTEMSGAYQHSWRADLNADLGASVETFREMALAADRYNLIAKVAKEAGENWDLDTRRAILDILTLL